MSISKAVLKKILASVVSGFTGIGGSLGSCTRRLIAFTFLVSLAASASRPAIATPLSNAVSGVENAATDVSARTTLLSGDLSGIIERYRLTNAGKCALLVVGSNSSDLVPINFIPGPTPIAGVQADILTDVPITMVMSGPAADAAGKTISTSQVPGGRRFILIGFNQNVLGAGTAVVVHYDATQAPAGSHTVTLANFSATSADGHVIPLCITTGVITK